MRMMVVVTVALAVYTGSAGPAAAEPKRLGRQESRTARAENDRASRAAPDAGQARAPDQAPDRAQPEPEPPSPPPPPEPPPTFTIAAVGDIMMGTTYPSELLPPDDGAGMLTEVTPILSAADVAFGNLEGPMIDGGKTSKCKAKADAREDGEKKAGKAKSKSCWAFRVPTRFGKYLKDAGFDVLSLANNHSLDFGEEGRQSSQRVLDELGITYSGAIGSVAHLTVRGKKIDVIAFATYNASYNLNDLDAAKAVVAESVANADLVIVSFHGGAEGQKRGHVPKSGKEMFYGENRGELRVFSHAMIEAGADLVLGHGPHVVRGMEVYNGRLIAYSLGNFATYRGMSLKGPMGVTLILEVHLDTDGTFLDGKIHPVTQKFPGGPKLDPKGEVIPMLKELSKADFSDTAVKIAPDGALSP